MTDVKKIEDGKTDDRSTRSITDVIKDVCLMAEKTDNGSGPKN